MAHMDLGKSIAAHGQCLQGTDDVHCSHSAAAPVAGAIAGLTAAAAYLDAKYHISKDIRSIRGQKASQRALERTGMDLTWSREGFTT